MIIIGASPLENMEHIMELDSRDENSCWPHAPVHRFEPGGCYIVTGGTSQKELLFNTPQKLEYLTQLLFSQCKESHWELHAWAVMENHYHFVAQAPKDAASLRGLITALHSKSARWLNKIDGVSGRKVWFQYWDTRLDYENSYLGRLNYVHNNPKKHGLVIDATTYPWCSKAWFAAKAESSLRNRVFSMQYDEINVRDDF